jgi:hypothetical protein
MPSPEERYRIWRKAFPSQVRIAEDIVWRQVAARVERAGAGIGAGAITQQTMPR